ncbi:MAG: hypothetical protein K6G50_09145 [bacterium]|nr:hypothetical protein [bacterium]
MAVWRLQTNTAGGKIAKYCIEKEVAAMGWSLRELCEDERKSIKEFDDFKKLAEKAKYSKYSSVERLATEVKVNDIIWIRFEGKYYFG